MKHSDVRALAPVMEVFASIQGEGAYVGEPQTFLRLRGCPLRCRWCDTPGSWRVRAADRARVGGRELADRDSAWATPFQAACWIKDAEAGALARTVSVTGGEPLMWPEFLLGLRSMVGERRLHLETAGAHPETLARVLDVFDHVSLDLKPDLDLDAPEEERMVEGEAPTSPTRERAPRTRAEWSAAREACLALVRDRDACGKIVVGGERAPADFAALFDEVERVHPKLLVILQPATPIASVPAPSRALLEAVVDLAAERGLATRVLPQVHRYLRMP
ncbi:MAG: 7-carboxy-7-deazaguanine synthase QueE [Planctomycetes bacterium]|nr:7-carboxy-7-deazaguanine synthase QueE [Planctomycetota bacterium]